MVDPFWAFLGKVQREEARRILSSDKALEEWLAKHPLTPEEEAEAAAALDRLRQRLSRSEEAQ